MLWAPYRALERGRRRGARAPRPARRPPIPPSPPVAMTVSLGASFGCFAAALGFFHASELALVAWHNGDNLSLDSALLQRPYLLAMAGGAAEFVLGAALFPDAKRSMVSHAFTAGATLVVFGEAVRKGAMAWAGRAFTHDIKTHRRDGHALVTSGPYAVCRHPGYGGWSLWAVGTQLMLGA